MLEFAGLVTFSAVTLYLANTAVEYRDKGLSICIIGMIATLMVMALVEMFVQ